MKKLPIGLQHFPLLVEEECLYVDKTELLFRLIHEASGHFLSRPRRFGKSLLLSTLAALFEGKRELFAGTWLATAEYHWECYPVLWFDFSTVTGNTREEVERSLNGAMERVAEDAGIAWEWKGDAVASFIHLIRSGSKEKRVVILVDEYDQPLLKNLNRGEELVRIRELMNDFFTAIKAMNRYIRYAFVTGVSKFSKVPLFSGMNHLKDLSLDQSYATLLGITEEELDHYYVEWIERAANIRSESVSDCRKLLRKWYNGYCFSPTTGVAKVYNPVSLHLFLLEGRLSNYWFGTATPTFAIELIRQRNYPIVNLSDGVRVGAALEEHHEVERPDLIPLLFQTGYLTIADYDSKSREYLLAFPNEEVKHSFFEHLEKGLTELDETQLSVYYALMRQSLRERDLTCFFEAWNRLFAEISYNLHLAKEAYYHSLIFVVMHALGYVLAVESPSSMGRLDLALITECTVYIIEFKMDASADAALQQVQAKRYAEKYVSEGKEVVLVGVNLSSRERKIQEWKEVAA